MRYHYLLKEVTHIKQLSLHKRRGDLIHSCPCDGPDFLFTPFQWFLDNDDCDSEYLKISKIHHFLPVTAFIDLYGEKLPVLPVLPCEIILKPPHSLGRSLRIIFAIKTASLIFVNPWGARQRHKIAWQRHTSNYRLGNISVITWYNFFILLQFETH